MKRGRFGLIVAYLYGVVIMGGMKKFLVSFFLLLPVVLSFLLLGAHFMRAGSPVLVVFSLLMIVGIFVRHKVSVFVMQGVLIIGGLE
jgi:hypothetical protein